MRTTKLKPIGRIDNGVFTLDETKHKVFLKKFGEQGKSKFQSWFDQQIEGLTKKHQTGHFLIHIRHTKKGASLKCSFDIEKYRNEKDGGFVIPISDLW